ncbi:T9SS type A sorting domain-containing protein, partial [bacterium]|nr:T9SS type A sorting domain-containing protein [bacterium]
VYTFSEWQRIGYDKHSVLIDPQFNNLTDFVPATRLDYGVNLGIDLMEGLDVDAVWGYESPAIAFQNGKWQVGARVFSDKPGEVLIWPNPATEIINILIPDLPLPYQNIKIYNSNGLLVYGSLIENRLSSVNIPSSFVPGMYNVSLESPGRESLVRKVLIIR